MDSIITQVTRESEGKGQFGGAGGIAGASTSASVSSAASSSNTTNNCRPTSSSIINNNENNSSSKKNFFTRLCCCCGGWRSSRKKKTTEAEALQNEELVTTGNLPEDQSLQTSISPGGYLLPPCLPQDANKPCMVIDLDETLVHSSFKPIGNADFIVPVEIDGVVHQVYVAKRPYVDEFLQKMGELYECVLFTASLAKYADPVADLLDKWGVFRSRLFRDACVFHRGNYVKDLNKLGRSLQRVVIVDNSPASYIFHPDNAVPVASWFDDTSDTELLYLIPFFERLATVENVYTVLRNSNHPFNTPPSAVKELLP